MSKWVHVVPVKQPDFRVSFDQAVMMIGILKEQMKDKFSLYRVMCDVDNVGTSKPNPRRPRLLFSGSEEDCRKKFAELNAILPGRCWIKEKGGD